MLAAIIHEKDHPNRVIKIGPYQEVTIPYHIPNMEIKVKFIREQEKSAIEKPFEWVWTINAGLGLGPPLTDSDRDRCQLLARKVSLSEKLWMTAFMLDRSAFLNILGSKNQESILDWELENDLHDDASLTAYLAERQSMDPKTYIKIHKINRDTYYRKLKELQLSVLKIQDQMASSDNPELVLENELPRLVGQPRNRLSK